ncbi:MAG: Osmosensitive channel histidine kinase KdpD [Acidimicrobiales bacterium]|nr:Osmosensitive channel histidine kinase KdpD [Acidimicrobiales bacterium]
MGLEWAYWRDASSAADRFERASGQITTTLARGLGGAVVYLDRVNGLVDGRTDLDSSAFARLVVTLPINGSVSSVGLAGAEGPKVVVRSAFPPGTAGLASGRELADTPEGRRVLDLARDDGTPAVAVGGAMLLPGPPAALIAYPEYGPGGVPATTAERRARLQGYLVAALTPEPVVETSLTPALLRITAVTITDGPFVFYGSPAAGAPRRAVVERTVAVANRTWTVTAWAGPGALPPRPPGWALGLALAALIVSLGAVALLVRLARRAAEAREGARAEEVRLIADAGPLLQHSLDLGELLPDFAVALAQQFDLDRLGVSVVNDEGQAVETFAIGPTPAAGRAVVEVARSTSEIPAGQDFALPLQRTGRTVGALRARGRRLLDQNQIRSLRAVADLLAAALGNAQLYSREQETVRRLRDLDRLKLSFLSTVSHELRTAVAAIEGFGSLLVEHWQTLSDEQRREFIDRIARNAASLKRLVDDLLDFARLERHALTVAPRVVSLSELVQQTVEQLASLLEQHHLTLDIAPDVLAFTDPDAMERILGNFLSNAAKYAPPNSTITVRVAPAGPRALLSVSDEGPGIPPEERSRVFTRFYRSDTEATHRTRGAGIGLAVVKEFADRLNTTVAVENAEGGGARFVALFPTEPAAAVEAELLGSALPDLVE